MLTNQDNFTKYSRAMRLPNHQAETLVNFFVEKCICIYGSPKAVFTNQGAHFLNNFMKHMAKKL